MYFVLVVLAHHRRRVVHFNVTEHPTAQWTGQQIIEAFPWDRAPKYLLRDRDAIYGSEFRRRVESMGTEEVLTAPRSPWQNGIAERWVGSVRRELLDHVVVLGDRHLRRLLAEYVAYYHDDRPHLGLAKGTPQGRAAAPRPTPDASLMARPKVGGLHHRYAWKAAA